MKHLITLTLVSTFLATSAFAGEATLRIPVTGDSGTTVKQINALLAKKHIKERLPEFVELSSSMSATEISDLKNSYDELVTSANDYEIMDAKGSYGEEVEGKTACFEGDINALEGLYSKMTDSFVSDQFSIMAVSTKRKDSFGLKYDESDSGSDGAWINIPRCK